MSEEDVIKNVDRSNVMKKEFQSIVFDTERKTFTILCGTQGTWDYRKIRKCSVLNEEANFRGKTEPFFHQVLGGTTYGSFIGDPQMYVGLKITMEDGEILAAYISDIKTTTNTSQYLKDHKEADQIKNLMDKIIQKYTSE